MRELISWGLLVVIVAATLAAGLLTGWNGRVLWASSACLFGPAVVNLVLGSREETLRRLGGEPLAGLSGSLGARPPTWGLQAECPAAPGAVFAGSSDDECGVQHRFGDVHLRFGR
jgi:hypothetical protein